MIRFEEEAQLKLNAKNVFKYTAYAGENIYSLKIKKITCKKTTCV